MNAVALTVVLFVSGHIPVEIGPDHILSSHDGEYAITLKFSADGKRLFSSYAENAICWDLATGKPIYRVNADHGLLFVLSRNEKWMAMIKKREPFAADQQLMICNTTAGKQQSILDGHVGNISHCTFSHDGKQVFSGGDDGKIRLFRTNDGKEVKVVSAHQERLACLAISPDSQTLATSSDDHSIKLWNASSLKELCTLTGPDWITSRMVFSPDGRFLAACPAERFMLIVWDVQQKKQQYTIVKKDTHSAFLAFSADGKTLLTAHANGIGIWDVQSGKEQRFLQTTREEMTCAALSPNGRYLAYVNEKHAVKLWDVKQWYQCATLSTTTKHIRSLVFSSDGMKIAGGLSEDGQISIWSLPKNGFPSPKDD